MCVGVRLCAFFFVLCRARSSHIFVYTRLPQSDAVRLPPVEKGCRGSGGQQSSKGCGEKTTPHGLQVCLQ
jgi:hypothetical protein